MYLTAPCVYLQTEGSLFGCAAQICPVCAEAGPSICGRENTSPYQGRPNGFAGLNCTSFNATTDAADPLCVVQTSAELIGWRYAGSSNPSPIPLPPTPCTNRSPLSTPSGPKTIYQSLCSVPILSNPDQVLRRHRCRRPSAPHRAGARRAAAHAREEGWRHAACPAGGPLSAAFSSWGPRDVPPRRGAKVNWLSDNTNRCVV